MPGVPLDTNLIEQALIMPVRYLAGSFNYKTEDQSGGFRLFVGEGEVIGWSQTDDYWVDHGFLYTDPVFSPDGRSIVFSTAERTLKRIDIDGGEPVTDDGYPAVPPPASRRSRCSTISES